MSQFHERIAAPAMVADEAATLCANDRSRRFTPLRSHVNRARAHTQNTRSELSLSRLVPISRLQS
jgi:hypothetical protein